MYKSTEIMTSKNNKLGYSCNDSYQVPHTLALYNEQCQSWGVTWTSVTSPRMLLRGGGGVPLDFRWAGDPFVQLESIFVRFLLCSFY